MKKDGLMAEIFGTTTRERVTAILRLVAIIGGAAVVIKLVQVLMWFAYYSGIPM